MVKYNFWDVLAWIALASIVLWAILKIAGIINSPLLIEYYPIFAASYAFGWQMNKLSTISEDVKDLKKFKEATIHKINNIEMNCKLNHFDKIK